MILKKKTHTQQINKQTRSLLLFQRLNDTASEPTTTFKTPSCSEESRLEQFSDGKRRSQEVPIGGARKHYKSKFQGCLLKIHSVALT